MMVDNFPPKIFADELDCIYMAVGLFIYWFPERVQNWDEIIKIAGVDGISGREAYEVYSYYGKIYGFTNLGGYQSWIRKQSQTFRNNENLATMSGEDEGLAAGFSYLCGIGDGNANVANLMKEHLDSLWTSQFGRLGKDGTIVPPTAMQELKLKNVTFPDDNQSLLFGVDKWPLEYRSTMRKILLDDENTYMPHPEISRMGAWHWPNMVESKLQIKYGKSCEQLREDYLAYACQRAYSVNNLKQRQSCPRIQLDHHDGYAAVAIFHSLVPELLPHRSSKWKNESRLRSALSLLLTEKVLPPRIREFEDWMSWFVYEIFHNTKNHDYFNTDVQTLNRVRIEILMECERESFLGMPGIRKLHNICMNSSQSNCEDSDKARD